jgi:hypothetical protein
LTSLISDSTEVGLIALLAFPNSILSLQPSPPYLAVFYSSEFWHPRTQSCELIMGLERFFKLFCLRKRLPDNRFKRAKSVLCGLRPWITSPVESVGQALTF